MAAAAAAAGGGGGGRGGGALLEVKIMTFNIRYGTAPDGDNRWELRRAAAAAAIAEGGADVVCLQEALRCQYDDLLAALGGDWVGVFAGRDDGRDGGEAAAILFRSAVLYSTYAPYVFWLCDTPEVPGAVAASWGARLPRMCLQLHFVHLPSGRAFWVLNTHTDHESGVARSRAAALVLSKLPDGGRRDPVIVTGDWNASPEEDAIVAMRHYLVDTVAVGDAAEASRATFHAFAGGDGGAPNRIDYIFATSGVAVRAARVDRAQRCGRWPSDHYPVYAHLAWR